MIEQQKLYACKGCNKIGLEERCRCGRADTDKLTLHTNALCEKPSIGNEDVFDRIDRELNQLRAQSINSEIRVDKLQNKIKSLEDRIYKAENYIPEGWSNYENRFRLLEEKSESFSKAENEFINRSNYLIDKVRKIEMTYPINKLKIIEDKIRSLEEITNRVMAEEKHQSKFIDELLINQHNIIRNIQALEKEGHYIRESYADRDNEISALRDKLSEAIEMIAKLNNRIAKLESKD